MFYVLCYLSQHTRIYVNETSYLKVVSVVYRNIRQFQPEDGLKRKAETCRFLVNIILDIQ